MWQPLGNEVVDHVRQVHTRVPIDDPLELLQLLREVALARLVAEESQLFNETRAGHIGVLNDVLKSHLHLLLQGFLQLLLDVLLHLIVLMVKRLLLLLRHKGLLLCLRSVRGRVREQLLGHA